MTFKPSFASLPLCLIALTLFLFTACGQSGNPAAFQATLPSAATGSAPIYTATMTATETPTPVPTLPPTATATLSPTPSFTPTITETPPPAPTLPLQTLTPVSAADAPSAVDLIPAAFASTTGWSCDDFPCEDDLDGWLRRIRVPAGFAVEHVGQFPGSPMQITYGPDGRLYATVLENGTRNGAVFALEADGTAVRYSGDLISPIGLAFQPGTDTLYVSARVSALEGGGLWRVSAGGGQPEAVISDLPCCLSLLDNQPNGLIFGPDGYLYMGIGALTDHAESPSPQTKRYADVLPNEAAILRINPHTAAVETFADGIRNPYDLTFDSSGQFYATDNGILAGPGDRLLAINAGGNYGWPNWRVRGCEDCPPGSSANAQPDLLTFPDFTLPRGLIAYTGANFPSNYFDNLFVVLWNGAPNAQRVVRIDPRDPRLSAEDYTPEPFITGLIRPIDVALAPDGSLVVADFIYGHVWRVRYTG